MDNHLPRLRLIDTVPVTYEGMRYLMLRDPYRLAEDNLFVPEPVIPLLALMDGTRSPAALRGALALRYGVMLSQERLDEFLGALDRALLLDNDNAHRAMDAAREEFRAMPFRPPSSAGSAYPADPQELARSLQGYLDQAAPPPTALDGAVRGLVSPHIDYERGGPVYAQVWSHAAQSVREAELAIIFGTDHFSEGYRFSLTRQNYATPFGVLPTAESIVDQLAQAIAAASAGEGGAPDPALTFRGELHHRQEHSIELAAVWLHFMREGKPLEIVPVLTGPLEPGGDSPDVRALLDVLALAMRGRRCVVIAAGDLAHIGPAFDTPPVDPGQLVLLKDADDALIEAMCQADAARFLAEIERVRDANNVCGVSPIYLTLRLLRQAGAEDGLRGAALQGEVLQGRACGYAICPADTSQTSVVSVCGVTLHA